MTNIREDKADIALVWARSVSTLISSRDFYDVTASRHCYQFIGLDLTSLTLLCSLLLTSLFYTTIRLIRPLDNYR